MSPLDIFFSFPCRKEKGFLRFVNLLDSEVVGLNVSPKWMKLGTFSPGPTHDVNAQTHRLWRNARFCGEHLFSDRHVVMNHIFISLMSRPRAPRSVVTKNLEKCRC